MAWTGCRWPGSKLAKPRLARKSRKVWPTIIGLHWPPLAGPKIGLACQETLTSLAKIKLQGMLVQGLP